MNRQLMPWLKPNNVTKSCILFYLYITIYSKKWFAYQIPKNNYKSSTK